MEKIFVTAINCMDGRVQEPVIDYMKKNFSADYVDMITEPGPNKILAENSDKVLVESIKKRVEISVNKHNSKIIAVTGHYDCAGNPLSKEKQLDHIDRAIKIIDAWSLPVKTIIGLWIDKDFKVVKNTGKNL